VSFGSVQCDFSPEIPVNTGEKSEVVPTRAELEYLRRENLDLQGKMAAMQKQIDILSSARLMTKDTQQLGVMPEVHRRVQLERDEARTQFAKFQLENESLRGDVIALTKERDALRVAWETAKRERDEALSPTVKVAGRPAAAAASRASTGNPAPVLAAPAVALAEGIPSPFVANGRPTPTPAAVPAAAALSSTQPVKPAPRPSDTVRLSETTKTSANHRAMATVLTKAPAALKAMRASLETLKTCDNPDEASQNISSLSSALAEALAPANGHSAHRLAAACAALVADARSRPWTFEPGVTRTLLQAAEVIGAMLDPRLFTKAAEAPVARALVIDDDPDLLETVTDALKSADIRATPCSTPGQGIEMLEKEEFDLVLLDVGLPQVNGIDLCSRIREMPSHRTTPVVFMTVDSTVDTRAQSSLSGGDDFMSKPFNVRELAVKAATWVARQQCGLRN
jgi:CheY-like chemotaxis protein